MLTYYGVQWGREPGREEFSERRWAPTLEEADRAGRELLASFAAVVIKSQEGQTLMVVGR